MRGQTTLDFALGVSIFLAVVLFVFAFVPGLLEPFALNSEEDTVLAGQVADRLAQDTLGDPDEPFVLDRHCAVSFFDEEKTPPDRCRYNGDSVNERLDLPETKDVRVTIERNITVGSSAPDTLCWDESAKELVDDGSCTGDDTELAIGDAVTEGTATITARRVVSLNGESVTLKVVIS